MEKSCTNKPKADVGKFFIQTLHNTLFSSRIRGITFCFILFLQFWAVPLIINFSGNQYADTYQGQTLRIQHETNVLLLVALVKYLLLLILIITVPAGQTIKHRLAVYAVLFWLLFVWIVVSILSSSTQVDHDQQAIAMRSFKEFAVPIYGRVAFASYKRDERDHKRLVYVAEKLSPKSNGYLLIVELDNFVDTVPGLKGLTHHFNYYTKDRNYPTNIQQKNPDKANCMQFEYSFPGGLKDFPDLPPLGKYVKIMYDPREGYIDMYTDSITAVTPYFDSIPVLTVTH